MPRRDLFPCQQRLYELVAEQLHEADRIRARDADDLSFRADKTVCDQITEMRVKPGRIVTVALQRGDHVGDGAAIAGGILEEFPDGGVETLAQQAEELAVVLDAEAEHLRT